MRVTAVLPCLWLSLAAAEFEELLDKTSAEDEVIRIARADRLKWLSKTCAKSPPEDQNPQRFRDGAGWSIDPTAFDHFGDVRVLKRYWYSFEEDNVESKLQSFYAAGTEHLDVLATTLLMVNNIVEAIEGFRLRSWRGSVPRIRADLPNQADAAGLDRHYLPHDLPEESRDRERGDPSVFDTYHGSGNNEFNTQELVRTFTDNFSEDYKNADVSTSFRTTFANVTMLAGSTADFLTFCLNFEGWRYNTGGRTRSSRLPHPRYLNFVDLEKRLDAVTRLREVSSEAFEWPLDQTLPRAERSSFALSFTRLHGAAVKLERFYSVLLEKYGNEYVNIAGRIEGGPVGSAKRVSDVERREIQRNTRVMMRAIAKAFKKPMPPNTRPDGLPQPFIAPLDVVPSVWVRMRVTDDGVESLEVSDIVGDMTSRLGPRTKARFAPYTRIIETIMRETIGNYIYATRPGWWSSLPNRRGATFQVHFRTELVCYWQRRTLRPRMLELLYIHIPGATSTEAPARIPVTDSAWLFAGLTYDSEAANEADDLPEVQYTVPPQEAVDLVATYALDLAVQAGTQSQIPGHFRDVQDMDSCQADGLLASIAEKMSISRKSSRGESGGRSFANTCVRYPSWYNKEIPWLQIYPQCLNMYPAGTEILFSGETKELPPQSPNVEFPEMRAIRVLEEGKSDKRKSRDKAVFLETKRGISRDPRYNPYAAPEEPEKPSVIPPEGEMASKWERDKATAHDTDVKLKILDISTPWMEAPPPTQAPSTTSSSTSTTELETTEQSSTTAPPIAAVPEPAYDFEEREIVSKSSKTPRKLVVKATCETREEMSAKLKLFAFSRPQLVSAEEFRECQAQAKPRQ